MSPSRSRSRRGRRRKTSASLLAWWPVALAIAATPFAARAASVLALSGPGALQLLYPSVALLQAHAAGQRDMLATVAMWTQFPLYGLVMVGFNRWRGIGAGLLAVLLLHGTLWAATQLWR